MNINKSTEPIHLDIKYGDGVGYDKSSLKAYKYEQELKRAVAQKEMSIRYHLFTQFNVPFFHEIRIRESENEAPIKETFSIIDLINSKLTSANSKLCLSTYEIFQREGIEKAIASLHQQSSLTII